MYKINDHKRRLNEIGQKNAYVGSFFIDFDRLMNSKSVRRLTNVTQLYPIQEFKNFRNRLTHSVEVSTIARSITEKINSVNIQSKSNYINIDLINFSSFAHDIGHPPFGHSGEKVLDRLMIDYGGFESNAQTLRILDKLEQLSSNSIEIMQTENCDKRYGLNLCYRSLASILKYDQEIPIHTLGRKQLSNSINNDMGLVKGYYSSESKIIKQIKKCILEPYNLKSIPKNFKTIECQIMDLADDIAFCISDLDDSLNSRFIDFFGILFPTNEMVNDIVNEYNSSYQKNINMDDVFATIFDLFQQLFDMTSINKKINFQPDLNKMDRKSRLLLFTYVHYIYRTSAVFMNIEQERISLLNGIKDFFLNSVKFNLNKSCSPLSKLILGEKESLTLFVLKKNILLNALKTQKFKYLDHQVNKIVTCIFEGLTSNYELLPTEYYNRINDSNGIERIREVCDFIASLDNNEILELYKYMTATKKISMTNPEI